MKCVRFWIFCYRVLNTAGKSGVRRHNHSEWVDQELWATGSTGNWAKEAPFNIPTPRNTIFVIHLWVWRLVRHPNSPHSAVRIVQLCEYIMANNKVTLIRENKEVKRKYGPEQRQHFSLAKHTVTHNTLTLKILNIYCGSSNDFSQKSVFHYRIRITPLDCIDSTEAYITRMNQKCSNCVNVLYFFLVIACSNFLLEKKNLNIVPTLLISIWSQKKGHEISPNSVLKACCAKATKSDQQNVSKQWI